VQDCFPEIPDKSPCLIWIKFRLDLAIFRSGDFSIIDTVEKLVSRAPRDCIINFFAYFVIVVRVAIVTRSFPQPISPLQTFFREWRTRGRTWPLFRHIAAARIKVSIYRSCREQQRPLFSLRFSSSHDKRNSRFHLPLRRQSMIERTFENGKGRGCERSRVSARHRRRVGNCDNSTSVLCGFQDQRDRAAVCEKEAILRNEGRWNCKMD
jgi:hypothetical protein